VRCLTLKRWACYLYLQLRQDQSDNHGSEDYSEVQKFFRVSIEDVSGLFADTRVTDLLVSLARVSWATVVLHMLEIMDTYEQLSRLVSTIFRDRCASNNSFGVRRRTPIEHGGRVRGEFLVQIQYVCKHSQKRDELQRGFC
jgi:hypothetical protein